MSSKDSKKKKKPLERKIDPNKFGDHQFISQQSEGRLTFRIPVFPPSVNHIRVHKKGFFKHPDANAFDKVVERSMRLNLCLVKAGEMLSYRRPPGVELKIYLCSPRWVTNEGYLKKMDLDNRMKPLMDAIMKAAEKSNPASDDSIIGKITFEKRIHQEEFIIVVMKYCNS